MPAFEKANLEDLLCFDRLLGELVQAGVPLQWTAKSTSESTVRYSKRVVQEISKKVSPSSSQSQPDVQSTPIWDTFSADTSLSPNYRLAFAAWVATDRAPDSLLILRDIRSEYPSTNIAWAWSLYLKVFLVLAVATFLIWQWTGGPALRQLYEDSSFSPGPIGRITTNFDASFLEWASTLSWTTKAIALLTIGAALLVFLFKRPRKNQNLQFRLSKETEQTIARTRFVELMQRRNVPSTNVAALLREASSPEISHNAPESQLSLREPFDDSLALNSKYWGMKRQIERELHKRASIRPFLLYLAVGGLITLLLAIIVFLPMYEFILQLDIEKRF